MSAKYIDFRNKVNWEGGVGGLVEYGWNGDTGDEGLNKAWRDLFHSYNVVQNLIQELDDEYEYESS